MMDGTDPKELGCGGTSISMPISTSMVDRISKLPDAVILVILSFLPEREAAATSLLSRRWPELWKHTPRLNFNTNTPHSEIIEHFSWDATKCKNVKMVNSVIQSHKALPLKRFVINFYVNKSAQAQVTKWLEFALSKNVESLGLNFRYGFGDDSHMFVLEESLRSQTLILFKSLKRLCLASLKVSGDDISVFLQNCPLLRELILLSSVLTSDIDVCAVNLEVLDIRFCFGRRSIKVSGPNLTRVHVDAGKGEKLKLENLPKVVNAGFRIQSLESGVERFASVVSSFISQLQTLTLTISHTKELLADGWFPGMPNLKELSVTDRGRYRRSSLLPITALIWASPRLRIFRFNFIGKVKNATPRMESIRDVERSPHQHLEMVAYRGPCARVTAPIVELMTYISNNCAALRTLTLGPRLPGNLDVQADKDRLKRRLEAKLPHHIQLQGF